MRKIVGPPRQLDTASGKITEYASRGRPYGLALDRQGNVWFCQLGGNRLGNLDPASGKITELETGAGSQPRRMSIAPDGVLWVTLYGTGKLIKIDTAAMKVVKEYDLPTGAGGGAYVATADGAGMGWANEINTDGAIQSSAWRGESVRLAVENVGIRKMIVDAQGRLWYVGSHNGRLGVIE